MIKTTFQLKEKRLLTHDVYELRYSCPDIDTFTKKPGQYMMFQLAPGLNRAYSFASYEKGGFTLIIKKIPDGRGSPILCDAEIGTGFSGLLPLGHFTLQETLKNKCFIGTGTGFAPLYCQLLGMKEFDTLPTHIAFIFGVRSFADSFYEKELELHRKQFQHFEYIQYFSRELDMNGRSAEHESRVGYVTEWITYENIKIFEEFYICGSPAMVKSAREKLESLGISKDSIFWEQF